jgi:hypothetical protein
MPDMNFTTARFPGHEQDAYRAKIEAQADRVYGRLTARSRVAWNNGRLHGQFAEEALNPGMADYAYGGE